MSSQFRGPVGAFEFMQQFYSVPSPHPAVDFSAQRVYQMGTWNEYDTPMIPVSVEGPSPSTGGYVNYSPLMPTTSFGMQAIEERQRFMKEIRDPRRLFHLRKQIMYDGLNTLRKKQNDSMQYIAPGTPEARYIESMIVANRDPGTGVEPYGVSLEQFRM